MSITPSFHGNLKAGTMSIERHETNQKFVLALIGIACGLIAPYTFNWIAEYPILIALAVLCRPGLALPKSYVEQIIFFGALAVAVLALVLFRAFEGEVVHGSFPSCCAAHLATGRSGCRAHSSHPQDYRLAQCNAR